MRSDVADKRVVVTGGSRGIGLAIARAFVSAGASVAILAEREEVFSAAAELERESGSTVIPIHCDVTDRARLKAAYRPSRMLNRSSMRILFRCSWQLRPTTRCR